MERRAQQWFSLTAAVLAMAVAGCSGSDPIAVLGTPSPTATAVSEATGTATPVSPEATITATPTATTSATAAVSGLVVLRQDVAAGPGDALGAPPQVWQDSPAGAVFDRALAHADWTVDAGSGLRGSTGADGSFQIDTIDPGHYSLQLTRTLRGDLVNFEAPFAVGDHGATVLVEVGQGLVRSSSSYVQDGQARTEVFAPGDAHLLTVDGRAEEIRGSGRTLVDADGDGVFDCEPGCPPVTISAIELNGPSSLVLGQMGYVSATATLDDGSSIEVTGLVDWESSDPGVATVDGWGGIATHGAGSAEITASLGEITSAPLSLQVGERPPLTRIEVRNVSCFYPVYLPGTPGGLPLPELPTVDPLPSGVFAVPDCRQVVRVGGTIQFAAYGYFGDSVVEDVSGEVDWELMPSDVGDVVGGLFTGRQEGTAMLRASLDGVVSDPASVRVVTNPTVVDLSIYADNGFFPLLDAAGAGAEALPPEPCVDCSYQLTVLLGDQLQFHATAFYDTGDWEDVTSLVTWRSSAAGVASIDSGGLATAAAAGDSTIDAVLGEVQSNAVALHVVSEATLLNLYIYQDGQDRAIAKGEQAYFQAYGNYDVGFQRDVTARATWRSSDESVGGFDDAGVFTGRAAGTVQVWAELDGQESSHLPIEVFEESAIDYCDPQNINRGVWSDAYDRVVLESDCATYTPPAVAALRFTVTERERPGGIFDPCLDLFVYQGDRLVRTVRNEGCGEPFLPAGAPATDEARPRYQALAFWDLKDNDGKLVDPGTYTVFGRFYLYFDPVVKIDITVAPPS